MVHKGFARLETVKITHPGSLHAVALSNQSCASCVILCFSSGIVSEEGLKDVSSVTVRNHMLH